MNEIPIVIGVVVVSQIERPNDYVREEDYLCTRSQRVIVGQFGGGDTIPAVQDENEWLARYFSLQKK